MERIAPAVVPAAPLVLAAAVPRPPADVAGALQALRADVRAALDALPPRPEAVVLLAAGHRLEIVAPAGASLAGYGQPDVASSLAGTHGAADALRVRLGPPGVPQRPDRHATDDPLDGDLAVLALLLAAARPDVPIVAVSVPSSEPAPSLTPIADALVSLADDTPIALIAAGDLSATLDRSSPGYAVDGAADLDRAVVDAVRAGSVDALAPLGPERARRVQARGWAPLVVLLAAARAAGAAIGPVRYHVPRGVGQLVVAPGA